MLNSLLVLQAASVLAGVCLEDGAQFKFQMPGGSLGAYHTKEKAEKECLDTIKKFRDSYKKGLRTVYLADQCCGKKAQALAADNCLFVRDSTAYRDPGDGYEFTQKRECIDAAAAKKIEEANSRINQEEFEKTKPRPRDGTEQEHTRKGRARPK